MIFLHSSCIGHPFAVSRNLGLFVIHCSRIKLLILALFLPRSVPARLKRSVSSNSVPYGFVHYQSALGAVGVLMAGEAIHEN